jgi:S-formylglutathione hydrolase FrmB
MKQLNALTLALILLISSATAVAGQADTILVHSTAMNKDIKVVVIRPTARPQSPATTRLPVVYLLHGHGGNYAQWPSLAPQLKDKADELNILLVCPDGGLDSWYFDSPVDPTVRYETFVIKELLPYIDAHYPTIADRGHRAITGLSMGGHGGLYLGIRHKDLFGAAGAASGGVDFRPFPNNWGIKKDLGTISDNKENWDNNTVNHAVEDLHNGELKLIFDCGTDDFFLTVNRQLHQKLLDEKIDHDYIERPGGHNNPYWRNSIDYQLLFFWKYFNGY